MQVVIFGATGPLGSFVVKEASSQGYSVKAFTRMREIVGPQLHIIQGDMFNFKDVERAIKGANAVLCCLGDGAKGTACSKGTQNSVLCLVSC
ncbi:MAG: NAD(P)H-binding protein [Bacteroidia bacterium]|nr:NAD(P)H-binding protein [Bacteroidia bacterium]